MVGNFKSLLTEEILDLWVSLVAFFRSGSIFPVIHMTNLVPLHLKCAPRKSSFEHFTLPFNLNKNQDTPASDCERAKWRGQAKALFPPSVAVQSGAAQDAFFGLSTVKRVPNNRTILVTAHQVRVRSAWKRKSDLGGLFWSIPCPTKLNCTAQWKQGISGRVEGWNVLPAPCKRCGVLFQPELWGNIWPSQRCVGQRGSLISWSGSSCPCPPAPWPCLCSPPAPANPSSWRTERESHVGVWGHVGQLGLGERLCSGCHSPGSTAHHTSSL